jgi:hypothetical protein
MRQKHSISDVVVRFFVVAFVTLCGSVVFCACSDDDSSAVCEPLDTRTCVCNGGAQGVQTCDGDGVWGVCVCEDGGVAVDHVELADGGVDADSPDAETPPAVEILVEDPLEGSTIGQQGGNGGGVFGPEGWTTEGGCISYDLGEEVQAGYARITLGGFTAPLTPAGWNGDKISYHLFNGGSFDWESKFKFRFGPTYDPFKTIYKMTGFEKASCRPLGDLADNLRTVVNGSDQNVYEIEWIDNELWFRVDGELLCHRTVDAPDNGPEFFALKEIRIGTDCVGEDFHPDVVITHVEVAKYNNP